VTVGAEDLEVFQSVCISWIFEPFAKFDVIDLDFARVKCIPAISADRSISKEYFFPQVHFSRPVFNTAPDSFVEKYSFSNDCFLCGIGVMPGSGS
jgi:hypothetical protein